MEKKEFRKFEKKIAKSENTIQNVVIKQRQLFYKACQKRGETFDQYLTNLRTLAATCQFAQTEHMIRDIVLLGLRDEQFKNALLSRPHLNLEKIVYECRLKEVQDMIKKEEAKGREQTKKAEAGKQMPEKKSGDSISVEELRKLFGRQPPISVTTLKTGTTGLGIVVNACKLCQTIHPANKCPYEVNKSFTEYAKPTEPCKTAPPKRSKSRNRNKGTPAGWTRPDFINLLHRVPFYGEDKITDGSRNDSISRTEF